MLVMLLHSTAMRIGFQRSQYTFSEPTDAPTPVALTLVKEGNRQSQQTFRVGITFGDPIGGFPPASLQLDGDPAGHFDYVINEPGNNYTSVDFASDVNQVTIMITLLPDTLLERDEGIRASITSVEGYPEFSLPLATSSVFANTLIKIEDADCRWNLN